MARKYTKVDATEAYAEQRRRALMTGMLGTAGALGMAASPLAAGMSPGMLLGLGAVPALAWAGAAKRFARDAWRERERNKESQRRGGKPVLGMPPQRDAFARELSAMRAKGKKMIGRYLVGYDLSSGEPLWVSDDELCTHAAVFAKTGVGKTLWVESLMFQQLNRGRASGLTFIDAKRDSGTLAQIILMCLLTGRIEDLIVVDPYDPVHSYNFCLTSQRSDVKARKVLRAGLPPTSDASTTKHYDRLASDSIYRLVRAMEAFGLSWSIHDMAVALSAFHLAYPRIREMLERNGHKQALIELGHLASSYRNEKGKLDTGRITDNLRGIASELHSIAGSDMGPMFCTNYTDLGLTDAILRGKIIYFMLPRLEEAEGAARMVKIFREDLEISIGEITSSRFYNLEDPHMVIIDEGSSTFGPTWANLFELARKGRFALIFGAQSAGGLTDSALGLSEAFYERVMANVNLKVMMRIGDNRTAQEMADWFGKVTTTRKTVGTGVSYGRMANEFSGAIDLRARMTGNESQTMTITEDEEDLVSTEELKHEMSAEKGLAWFDLGDGKVRKGKAFWFNTEIPDTWTGREFVTLLERFENDELGLAEWVNEQILNQEEREGEFQKARQASLQGQQGPGGKPGSGPAPLSQTSGPPLNGSSKKDGGASKEADTSGPFKLNLAQGGRSRGRVNSFVMESQAEEEPKEQEEEQGAQQASKAGAGSKMMPFGRRR